MITKLVTGVVALTILVLTLLVMLPDISRLLEDARTTPATDTGLACATGAADTSCVVSLSAVHQYSTTAQMTVTETSPGAGDVTASSSLAVNRSDVTVSSLATSTAYTFNVSYAVRPPGVSEGAAGLLRVFIPALVLLLFGATLAGVAVSLRGWRGR